MARAGRKMKQGKRTQSGRLSKEGRSALRIIKGNERAQAMQALYGTNGSDAIGRAFESGLLGAGAEAQSLLDTARSIAKAYWAAYVEHPPYCTLSVRTGGGASDLELVKRREQWLNAQLKIIAGMGHMTRRMFDQLVIDPYPDCGPAWLDACIHGSRTRNPIPDVARASLNRALDALKAVAS